MIAIIKFLFIATIISLMLTIAMAFAYHWAMKRLDDINRWNDGTAKIASAAGLFRWIGVKALWASMLLTIAWLFLLLFVGLERIG